MNKSEKHPDSDSDSYDEEWQTVVSPEVERKRLQFYEILFEGVKVDLKLAEERGNDDIKFYKLIVKYLEEYIDLLKKEPTTRKEFKKQQIRESEIHNFLSDYGVIPGTLRDRSTITELLKGDQENLSEIIGLVLAEAGYELEEASAGSEKRDLLEEISSKAYKLLVLKYRDSLSDKEKGERASLIQQLLEYDFVKKILVESRPPDLPADITDIGVRIFRRDGEEESKPKK